MSVFSEIKATTGFHREYSDTFWQGILIKECLLFPCRFRLAKATLTLIPLFGIHEIVFIFATDEQTTGVLRYIKVFFTLFLNSFQAGSVWSETGCFLLLIRVHSWKANVDEWHLTNLASLQGFLVAVLYCYANKEVSGLLFFFIFSLTYFL